MCTFLPKFYKTINSFWVFIFRQDEIQIIRDSILS